MTQPYTSKHLLRRYLHPQTSHEALLLGDPNTDTHQVGLDDFGCLGVFYLDILSGFWGRLVSLKKTGWWFQIFFIFTPIWGRFPFWLIFFRWVETTNQKNMTQMTTVHWRNLPGRWGELTVSRVEFCPTPMNTVGEARTKIPLCPWDPGSPYVSGWWRGVLHHQNETQVVFRFHETILSFGEPGSLGYGAGLV